jgi:peptide/nickel transport system substrate-binding protein
MILNPEQWNSQTGDDEFYRKNTKAYGLEWTSFHFVWNVETPFFSDVRVRKAMSYALDYDEMLDNLLYGLYEPCNGPFHHTSRWAPKDPLPYYKQDFDKAEDLLDEAGWADHDGDGIRDMRIGGRDQKFEFSLLVATSSTTGLKICQLLKDNLDQIGVICNIRSIEFPVLMEKTRKHEFQAAFGGWGTGADPDTSENIFGTGQGRNYGQYSNPEIDALYKQGREAFEVEDRAKAYARIHEILYGEQVYTWLFYRSSFYGFNKQLRGYKFSPRGPYHYGPGFESIWKPAAM